MEVGKRKQEAGSQLVINKTYKRMVWRNKKKKSRVENGNKEQLAETVEKQKQKKEIKNTWWMRGSGNCSQI